MESIHTPKRCRIKRLFAIFTATVSFFAFASCRTDNSRDVRIYSDDNCFQLNYTLLNRGETSLISLEQGDCLKVVLAQEEGNAEITVGIDGKNPIYEGNNLTDIAFTLNIQETGTYRITVNGHDARGNASFTKVEKNRRNDE